MSAARPETGATEQTIADWTWERDGHRTGATRDQAERVAREIKRRIGTYSRVDTSGDLALTALAALVPPGSVIALAEHVVSAADREAIGRGLRLLNALEEYLKALDVGEAWREFARWQSANEEFTPEHRARLERLGSGGEGER